MDIYVKRWHTHAVAVAYFCSVAYGDQQPNIDAGSHGDQRADTQSCTDSNPDTAASIAGPGCHRYFT
jgi:hypothetical protein